MEPCSQILIPESILSKCERLSDDSFTARRLSYSDIWGSLLFEEYSIGCKGLILYNPLSLLRQVLVKGVKYQIDYQDDRNQSN